MKLNLKVRVKNPTFWATFIPAVLTFMYTLLGLFDIVPAISKSEIMNVVSVAIAFLTNVGVLVDPTTVGFGDSSRAMTYTEPNKE
jgi:phi LC3 family holin